MMRASALIVRYVVLLARLESRAVDCRPGTYLVCEQQLDEFIVWFEPPTPDELR